MDRVPRLALLLALVGIAFAAGVVVGTDSAQPSGPDPERPPYQYSHGGHGCLAADPADPTGWLHVVASGRSTSVTMDAQVAHERGELNVSVRNRSAGRYAIAIRTGPENATSAEGVDARQGGTESGDRSAGATEAADCRRGTRFNFGASLPTDVERIAVRVNGQTVTAIDRESTTARLVELPTPIAA
ncbi:hypothetical protein [Halomicrobium salinisoli]|uniref:hypothetical protein n=1 Tax=Halomicrobium salinisoli TaxID=2878391 RepID=UPI001CF06F2C|nr:hypothetical protein [Halomicrobium salinisoli]